MPFAVRTAALAAALSSLLPAGQRPPVGGSTCLNSYRELGTSNLIENGEPDDAINEARTTVVNIWQVERPEHSYVGLGWVVKTQEGGYFYESPFLLDSIEITDATVARFMPPTVFYRPCFSHDWSLADDTPATKRPPH